ncbi:hypothetical protein J4219_01820 [Candidatus Woesearchaeota archaeon]|nr:hypothetical protein [Candidatus Woesearchaeota archaeon]
MGAAVKIAKLIQERAEDILSGKTPPELVENQLKAILVLDLQELEDLEGRIRELRRYNEKIQEAQAIDELVALCNKVLADARQAIEAATREKRHDQLQALLNDIISLEKLQLSKLIRMESQDSARTHFEQLLARKYLEEDEVEQFLSTIRGKLSSNSFKKIEKALKEKVSTKKSYPPGPQASDENIRKCQRSILNFFSSDPLVRITLNGEPILFVLYGSLITGYSNNPKKLGLPSDFDKTSDVDILIVLKDGLFDEMFGNLSKKFLFETRGMRNTAPMGRDCALQPSFSGPFVELFRNLSNLTFAGKSNRPIHLVFTDESTWKRKEELHERAVELSKEYPDSHIIDVNKHKIILKVLIGSAGAKVITY